MGKRIYQAKTNATIKVRLQHTDPSGDISPLLEELAASIDKTKLCAFNAPRLGTNPKYDGQQATAMYLEIDAELLLLMFCSLKILKHYDVA